MTEYTVVIDCKITEIIREDESFTEKEIMSVTPQAYAKAIKAVLSKEVDVDDVVVNKVKVFPVEVN